MSARSEFSSHGDFLRELTLPDDDLHPRHVIQTCSGQFIVCHGEVGDPVNRLRMMSADGRHIVHSHGGELGSDAGQYHVPICCKPVYMAVDDNEFVFVADPNNRRVKLLSPTLHYVREVVSHNQLKWWPWRLCLDTIRRQLYISDTALGSGESSGRVVVVRL